MKYDRNSSDRGIGIGSFTDNTRVKEMKSIEAASLKAVGNLSKLRIDIEKDLTIKKVR